MSRPLRFIPEEGALVDITCRTIQSRYLLRPDPALNEIVLGVLGRAQRLHPVEIVDFVQPRFMGPREKAGFNDRFWRSVDLTRAQLG